MQDQMLLVYEPCTGSKVCPAKFAYNSLCHSAGQSPSAFQRCKGIPHTVIPFLSHCDVLGIRNPDHHLSSLKS